MKRTPQSFKSNLNMCVSAVQLMLHESELRYIKKCGIKFELNNVEVEIL